MTTAEYWIIHDSLVICSVSEKVLLLFRCAASDLLGRDIFEIIPIPEMRELAKLRMTHIRNKGDLHKQELPITRPDGSMFWARIETRRAGLDTFVSTLEYMGEHNPHYHGT